MSIVCIYILPNLLIINFFSSFTYLLLFLVGGRGIFMCI